MLSLFRSDSTLNRLSIAIKSREEILFGGSQTYAKLLLVQFVRISFAADRGGSAPLKAFYCHDKSTRVLHQMHTTLLTAVGI